MKIITGIIALLLGVVAHAGAGDADTRPNIYIMRHLHASAGTADPDLSETGQRYASLLDQWFQRDPPQAIYVSDTNRAGQTAAPFARRLDVRVKVYNPSDTPALIASVLREQGTVLIVGHSNTVPDIVAGLGGTRPAPLAHEQFGDIWQVRGPKRVIHHFHLSE